MLEGMGAVDWAALSHAYGPATDVPGWLRSLRSPDPEVRQWAREHWNIVHQGTRYAATAPAVPFLVELALADDTRGRDWLVWLLTYAAIGYDADSLPDGIVEVTLDQLARTTNMPEDLVSEGEYWEYAAWALAAYQAVQAAVPSLLPLLDDHDVRVRRAVAYLLAWFPHWASSSLPLLRARLGAEPDPDAKATMVVALGLLAGGRGETSDRPRLEQLLGDATAVVRWAAAVALARLFPQAPPEPAVAELLGWVTGEAAPGRRPAILFPIPEQYAMLVVRAVPVLRERAAEAILARLLALSGQVANSLVGNLITLAFQNEQLPRGVAFADLPPLQQRVLRALPETPGLWRAEDGLPSPLASLLVGWAMSSKGPCTTEELQEQLRAYVDA